MKLFDCENHYRAMGQMKGPKMRRFISELAKEVDGKAVVLYGGAKDSYAPTDEELIVRVNYHFRGADRTDIGIVNILRLAGLWYYNLTVLSGVAALRALTECSPKSILVAGCDFYLNSHIGSIGPGVCKDQVGSHPIKRNVEILQELIKNPNVELSFHTDMALETYKEYFEK